MAANKKLPKQPESDQIRLKKDWPGPGAYSPKNNMIETAEKLNIPAKGQIIKGENAFDTMRSSIV